MRFAIGTSGLTRVGPSRGIYQQHVSVWVCTCASHECLSADWRPATVRDRPRRGSGAAPFAAATWCPVGRLSVSLVLRVYPLPTEDDEEQGDADEEVGEG